MKRNGGEWCAQKNKDKHMLGGWEQYTESAQNEGFLIIWRWVR